MYEQQANNFEQTKSGPERYRNMVIRLKNKLDIAIANLFDTNPVQAEKILKKVTDFSEKIKQGFPEHESYGAWHGLAGSTILNSAIPVTKLDFLGEYNVKNFLGKLLAGLENLEK